MSEKRIPETPEENPEEENPEDDEEIPSFCDIFIPSPSTGEDDDEEDKEDNNEKKK